MNISTKKRVCLLNDVVYIWTFRWG